MILQSASTTVRISNAHVEQVLIHNVAFNEIQVFGKKKKDLFFNTFFLFFRVFKIDLLVVQEIGTCGVPHTDTTF